MPRILLAESYPLVRPALEKILRDGGYEVSVATNSREVVGLLCDQRHDLLLIDLDMTQTGSINTVRYLRGLAAGAHLKVLGLTSRRERQFVLESLRSGVTALLLKEECTSAALLDRIRQLMAAEARPAPPPATVAAGSPRREPNRPAPTAAAPAPGPPLPQAPKPLALSEIEAVIPKMLQGQALRPVVQKVIALSGNPNVDGPSLALVLRPDLELSAKVIAAANRAYYRRRNITVGSLTEAINLIGVNGTRNLAMSLAVIEGFRADGSDPLLSLQGLWGHSISVAHIAERLAQTTEACAPDQAFVVGLLHDLGRMLMAQHLSDHYRHVVHAAPATAPGLCELERRFVGADHALLGGMVTERWGCPSFISQAVRQHHSASVPGEAADGADSAGAMVKILSLADAIGIALGFAGDGLEELPVLPASALTKAIKAPAEFRDSVLESLRETQAVIMSRADLSIEIPAPWSGQIEQILFLGAALCPLEPLQLMLQHAYHDAAVVNQAKADRGVQRTLIVADLRGIASGTEADSILACLSRPDMPAHWPVLVVGKASADQPKLPGGAGDRRLAGVSCPLRPASVQRAVESLASEFPGATQAAA